MHWAEPAYAWLVALAIPATTLLAIARRRRQQDMRQLTGDSVALSKKPFGAEVLLVTIVFLLVVAALSRPQWGQTDVRRESRGLDIIVALDVSRSMLADDLAPTRLAAAKNAVIDLLPKLQGDRIGLIAFAGSAFLVCPLTGDYDTFATELRELDTDAVPLGGTSLLAGLIEAKRAFSATQGSGKVLFLVTDGEDQGTNDMGAVDALRSAGVTVFPVAVGTTGGGLVRLADGEFLRDRQGVLVNTRMQTGLLDRIAAATGGHRTDLFDEPQALATLYGTALSAMQRREIQATRRQLAERYQIPLALALLLLLLEPLVAHRSRPRR